KAYNNPSGYPPNWFYYWKEGGVCGIPNDVTFDKGKPSSWGGYFNPNDKKIYLCAAGANSLTPFTLYSGNATYGQITVGGTGKGIAMVPIVLKHENTHKDIDAYYNNNGGSNCDGDKDKILDNMEANYLGLSTDQTDPDTYNMGSRSSIYNLKGDNEVRARNQESNHTTTVYPKKDWANPGCQHKNQYGPTP
ncbi:MAG: hypothetical protein HQL32_15560, partial [Planctomycetes bacterium]|nr:hypothetical protein [Planctomycetota bacterium]